MFNQKESCLPDGSTALNIKSVYKDMQKFITKETLPDILSDLAETFLENSEKIAIDITLVQFTSNCRPTLKIRVSKNGTWENITDNRYDILDTIYDCVDVHDETLDDAIAKL